MMNSHKSSLHSSLFTLHFTLALAALCAASAFAAGTLPAGYTEVEYIQGPGNARILTNYTPQPATDKVEAVAEWPANTISANVNQGVWCARGNGLQVDSWTLFVLGTQFRFDYSPNGHGVSLLANFTISTGTKYTITAENNTITYVANGLQVGSNSTPAYSYTVGGPVMLFASYHSGTGSNLGNYGKQKLYSFKVWRSGELIHYFVPCKDSNGAATLVDICDNPATLTRSGTFTAGTVGHYFDDSLFLIPDDTLIIAGSPSNVGSPSPAYGNQTGLNAGDSFLVSCGEAVQTNGTLECFYQGWKLYDVVGNLLANGTETSFTYEHPTPAKGRKLAWQWKVRPVGADATDLLPTLCMTFDGQSLANTGTGTATMTDEGTVAYVTSEKGYALDTGKYVPYGTLSSVFAANRDSAIAVAATLGSTSTGILVHFKNSGNSIGLMLRRGTTANQVVLTENSSTTPLITVNDVDHADTDYHLYVVNILSDRVDLYVDGVFAGTTATTPRAIVLDRWQMGSRSGGALSGEVKYGGGLIDDIRVYADALGTEQMMALADSLGLVSELSILPISDQTNETFDACCPEFVVSNSNTSATYTIGGDIASPLFDVVYTDNYGAGEALVTVTGKCEYAGEKLKARFNIVATKLMDENISTTDTAARRLEVNGKSVYLFKDATSPQTVTAKRNLAIVNSLLVGGGGGGGRTMGGGGGGGGVNATSATGAFVAKDDVFTVTVGAGGAGSAAQKSKGGNGGDTSLVLGSFVAAAPGGGGAGSWENKDGASGGSGGGGCASGAGGAGTVGFGCAGAAGLGANNRAGGGGGAGHAGYKGDATANHAGYGGEGVSNNITGAWVVYGGGGGAGGSNNGYGTPAPGLGGLGGGGDGSKGIDGNPGVDGLGGGGGGGGYGGGYGYGSTYCGLGGNGGSGIAILALVPADFVADAIPAQYTNPDGCTPDPVVHYGETLLVKDTDYTVAYANNTAPGVAMITITGINTYAGKVGYATFEIMNRLCAKPEVAEEGDGSSWAHAMSWTNALAAATAEQGYVEIWLSGDMTLAADPATLAFTKSMVIRGGFAGTEVTPDERAIGAMSTLDGQGAYTIMTLSNGAGAPVVLDGLRIFNGKRGIVKTGAGDITIVNSAIVGNHTSAAGQNGIGLSLTGTADAKLVVSNSVISGNYGTATSIGNGQGLYVTAFGSVLITDTTFLTNGLAWTAANLWNEGRDGQYGAALFLNNVAATVKGCTFRGNRGSSYNNRGGIVRVAGTGGGTLFDHCVFAGNEEDYHWRDETTIPNGGSNGGQIAINLASETDCVTISNCTLACNFSDNSKSAVGVTVAKGTAVIRNSIIANNIVHYSNSGGADLALMTETAHAEVSHSVLSADGPSSYTSLVEGNLSFGDGVRFGDPALVSSTNDVSDLLVIISSARKLRQFDKTKLAEVLALDVHALSPTGYFTNDGTEHVSGGDYSRAIDAGDPMASVGDEPSPNGGVVNAGAYGGTAQASKTAPGAPAVSGNVTVAFDEDYSRPTIRFTVGGTGSFFARASVYVTTNDVDWVLVDALDGLVNGDVVACPVNAYYLPGYIRAKVVLTASGVSDTATSAATPVTKPLPPWWGKGGPANVIHVRPGAIGTGSGENWLDAVPDLWSAYSLVSAEKNEIWIAGTNVLKTGSITLSAVSPLAIRGGFQGWENSPEERPDGFRSVIDGDDKTDCLTVANSAALEVERIHFTRGLSCGLIKSGAGDMRVSDCLFFTNGTDQATNSSGKGARVAGTKTTTVVAFTNCVFRGNRARTGMAGGCPPQGGGINASSLKCLRIEDCTFVHNGIYIRSPGGANSGDPSTGNCSGSAVYSSAPVSAVGCRFAANFGTVRNGTGGTATTSGGYGGTVRLVSGSEGSAFTNCAWVANGDEIVWPGFATAALNTSGPLVVHFGNASGTVDVERCTFAYNLADGFETTAGLNLILGTANVHNSIFFGNILGGLSSTRGQDISLRGASVCNVSYTLFGELGSNSVSCAETATTNFLGGIVVGDPCFVTPNSVMTNLVKKSGNLIFWDWTTETFAETYAALENANVHVRGCYYDENTGDLVLDYVRPGQSPAVDAGDPASDYRREPVIPGVGGNGHRVNLGYYGNTPWATMSKPRGTMLIMR